jgi:AcrR family transcriptional regulator
VDEMKPETNRVPLRERNRRRLYQRIVDAAFELFRTVGYEQTTMDAIAERAEVSRGTLFNYFVTKQTLLIPFAHELYKSKVQPEVLSALDSYPTTLEALKSLFLSIEKHVLTFPGMDRGLQLEFFHKPPPAKEMDYRTGFLETVKAILQHGQQRGDVRVDIPPESLARYVGVLYVSVLFAVMKEPMNYAREVERLLDFLLPALAR